MAEENVNQQPPVAQEPKIPVDTSGGPIGGFTPTDIQSVDVDFNTIKDELFIPNSGEPITTTLDPTVITNANALANVFTYNPVVMNYPYDMDVNSKLFNPEVKEDVSTLGNTLSKYQNPVNNQQLTAGGPEGLQPLKFDMKATNYDRYNNKGFKELFNDIGFHPYVDNETIYNAQSTWWDENARMRGQWGRVFSTGFMSTYDAIGDAINGNYLSGDLDGADAFEDAMRIGNSSKDGAGAFFNNLALNSGYTFGILSNIAVEELALAGLEAVTLGGATPIVASRTAYNIVRLGKTVDKTVDVAKGTKQSKALINKLNDPSQAYDFWRAGGKWALNAVTPNTYKAIKEINTVKNTAKALSLSARNAKTAGGFYRDVRAINLAMSESKLESGMVENNMYKDLYKEHVAKFGSRPMGEDLTKIKQTAAESGFTTLMWNFPVIFFSNQIVLGTALRGFKGVGRALTPVTKASQRTIARSAKEIAKDVSEKGFKTAFIDGGTSALGRIYKRGISGNLVSAGASLLRYSSANLAEGFQELTQEAIAVASEDYYKKLYADPAMGGIDAQMASVYAGVDSQMSGQGFEVFMSGFLMGGLVQGPQKMVFNGLPALYQRVSDPKAYAEYKAKEEEYIKESVATLNKMYNDPDTYFNETRINAMLQKEASENMFESNYAGDVIGFQDQKDAAIFHSLYTAASLNKLGDFSKMFSDFASMDSERLIEAMPEQSKEDINSGKTRERLNNMVVRAEEMRKSYEALDQEISNPFDPSIFPDGSTQQREEQVRKAAFNHAKMLAMFARNSFTRALERTNAIYSELNSNPIVSNMAANDINLLTDMQALMSEINLLKTEIEIATDVQTSIDEDGKEITITPNLSTEEKVALRNKQERLIQIQDIFAVLTDQKNVSERPEFSDAELNKIEDLEDRAKQKAQRDVQINIIEKVRKDILSTSLDKDTQAEFLAVYSGHSNPFGEFNIDSSEKFKEKVLSFLQFLAKKDDVFIDTDSLDSVIKKILDSKSLGTRAEILNKAVATILNPGNLVTLAERMEPRFKQMFLANRNGVEERLRKYVDVTKKNIWLNELSAIGVYPDLAELDGYLKDKGPMPSTYLTDSGPLTEESAQYAKAATIISTQENISKPKETTTEEVDEDDDVNLDYENNFLEDDIDNEIDEKAVSESRILGNLYVKEKWINYVKNQTQSEKQHLPFEKWVNDKISKKARTNGIAIDDIHVKIYNPLVFTGKEKLKPFYEWLSEQKENQKVLDVVNLYNVSIYDLTNQNTDLNYDTQLTDQSGGGLLNVKTRDALDKKTKKKTKVYYIADKNDNPVNDKVFINKKDAVKAKKDKIKKGSVSKVFTFSGKDFSTGSILTKENKEYIVKATEKSVKDNNNLFVREVSKTTGKTTGKNIYLDSNQIKEYSVVTAKDVSYRKDVSKLKMREATNINPTYDTSITDTGERTEQGVSAQQKLFRETAPASLQDLSIRIARGKYVNKTKDSLGNAFQQGTQQKNNKIRKNIQKLSIELFNGQGSFGYFNGPETVLLTDGTEANNIVLPSNISEADVLDYFEIPKTMDGQKLSLKEAVRMIKSKYAQSYYIYKTFEDQLVDTDMVVSKISDYPDLMLNLSEGSVTANKNNPLIFFDELDTMFVSEDTTNTTDGEKPYYIMDYNRTYVRPVAGKKTKMKVKGVPITNINQSSDFFTELEDKVEAYEKKYAVADRLGKYVAFVTLKNGKSAFVPLTASIVEPEKFNVLLLEMQEQAKKVFETNVNKDGTPKKLKQTDEINEKISNEIFLSAEPGIYIELSISNDGQLGVHYTNMKVSKKSAKRSARSFIANEELMGFKDVAELIRRLNSFVKPIYPKGFTINDIKTSVQKGEGDIGIMGTLQTKFTKEILKNFNLQLLVNPNVVSLDQIERSALNTPIENKLKVIDNTKEIKVTAEEKRAILKSDYEVIDPVYALDVVRRVTKGKVAVSEFEQEIYDNMDPELRTGYTMEVLQEVNKDLTNTESLLNQNYQSISFKAEEDLQSFEDRYWDTRSEQIKAAAPEIEESKIIDLIAAELEDIEFNPFNPLNTGYKVLKQIRDDADGKAFKITNSFDGNAIEDVETYTNWFRNNLNEKFVSLDFNIDNLQNNMINGNMLAGQFLLHQRNLGLAGQVTVGTNNPFKYHEAFHAVFRMFLTEEEIKKYLKLAKIDVLAKLRKEGKTLSSELALMRKTHALYSEMSRKELEERFIEEYMADQFEAFKMDPLSSTINTEAKSLFRRIIDIILSAFGFPTYTLNSLFTNIDSGKYKNAGVQENRFTTAASKAPSVAYKTTINLGTRKIKTIENNAEYVKTINHTMPAHDQHIIVSGMTNLYNRRRNNASKVIDKNIMLDGVVNDFIDMYDTTRQFYKDKGVIWFRNNYRKVQNYHNSLIAQKDKLKEMINSRLLVINESVNQDENEFAELQDETGDITTDQWDKVSEEIGGFGSAPKLIRELISTVTYETEDMFGNTEISENEPVEIGVNYTKIYDSILKATSNQPNPVKMLQQLWVWSQGSNVETKAVVDTIFKQMGYYEQALDGSFFNPNMPMTAPVSQTGIESTLFNMFTKQFENYYIPYLLQFRDKKTNVVHTYAANKADDSHHTLTQWSENFNRKYQEIKIEGSKENKEAIRSLNALSQFISYNAIPENINLIDDSVAIAKRVSNATGMKFDSNYILFSLLNRLNDNSVELSAQQKILFQMNQFADPLTSEEISRIVQSLGNGENLFLDNQTISEEDPQAEMTEEGDAFYEGGVKGKLRKIALNNSYFDETVGASTFINEEGNRIYAHQRATLHLQEIARMSNEENYLDNKLIEDPFLKDNFLVSDPKFKSMLENGQVTISRMSGIKDGVLNLSKEGRLKENKGFNKANVKGTKFGSLTPQDFIALLVNNYTSNYNRLAPDKTVLGSYIDTVTGKPVEFAFAPAFIRVIEASNTGDNAMLPVHRMIESAVSMADIKIIDGVISDELIDESDEGSVQLTEEAYEGFEKILRRDAKLIQQELDPETRTKDDIKGADRLFKLSHTGKKLLSKLERRERNISVYSDPKLGADTKKAIRTGKQKVVLSTQKDAASTQLISLNDKGLVNFSVTNDNLFFTMTNKGKIEVNDLSTVEVTKLIKDLGPYVLTAKPANKRMFTFKLLDVVYYTYSSEVSEFFKGNQPLVKFEFVDPLEDTESDIIVNTDETTGQVTMDMVELDSSPADTFELLINEGESFDSAWKAVDGRKVLNDRLFAEANEFMDLLQEFKAINKISADVTQGLGRVSDIESGKIINDIDTEETGYLMEKYNLKYNDPDFNILQIFLNDYINTVAINEFILGDQRFSIKDAVDAIKRAKMQNAAGKSVESLFAEPKLGVEHRSKNIDMLLHEDSLYKREFEKIFERDNKLKGEPGERGDGQIFITTKAHRYWKFGLGELTPEVARILDLVEAGNEVALEAEYFGNLSTESHKQLGAIMNSQKLVYADGKVYLKMSVFTLTPLFTSIQDREGNWTIPIDGREGLHNLRIKLEAWESDKDTVAIAAPVSASKMLKANVLGNAAAFDTSEVQERNMTRLDAQYMRLQMVNPSNKIFSIDPRQIKNLITSEQDHSVEVSINGNKTTIGAVINAYHKLQSDKTAINWFAKRNLIFDFKEIHNDFLNLTTAKDLTINLSAFLEFAIAGLQSASAKADMLAYFSKEDNGTGEPQFNLNNQATRKKFQSLFLSFFSKGVLSAQQPGISAALVTDDGFNVIKKAITVDENGVPTRWTVIRNKDWRDLKRAGAVAKGYTNIAEQTHEGVSEKQYYVDRLRSDVMGYDSNNEPTGILHTEFVMAPHHKSVLDHIMKLNPEMSLPDAVAKMYGIRIPSQDKHSAVNLMLVDFLPVYYGSSAIYARELVELSGADFDIDKLYMQIKEFFYNGKDFVEYGDAKTETGKYNHYIKWALESAKEKGSPIRQAVDMFLESQTETIPFNLNEWTNMSAEETKVLNDSEKIVADAMSSTLGLPVSQVEYSEYKEKYNNREPYSAAIDNQILDHKYALQGSSSMTKARNNREKGIAYEPANIRPLSDPEAAELFGAENAGVWDYIKKELPELAKIVNEEDIDIDNLRGKLLSFKANKEGSKSIGAVVSPNSVLSIAKEFSINLESLKNTEGKELIGRLTVNGISYSEFVDYSVDPKTGKADTKNAYRTQYVISALITAMTDNAKERLADKLGLNKNALAMVATMTAMGVDIKTSILLMNQPAIRSIMFAAINKDEKTDPGVKSLLESRLKELVLFFEENTATMSKYKPKITTDYLVRKGNDIYSYNLALDYTEDKINDALLSDLAKEHLLIEQVLIVLNQTEFLRNVSVMLSLQKSFGEDLFSVEEIQEASVELGLTMTDKEWAGTITNPNLKPFDFRPVFSKATKQKPSFHATNYKVFRENYDYLFPKLFLEASVPFKDLTKIMTANMVSLNERKDKEVLANNITTYLNTVAYLKSYTEVSNKEINGTDRQTTQDSLNNNLIYNPANYGRPKSEALTIVKVMNNLIANKKNPNYLVDEFLSVKEATNEDNFAGIDKLSANNFTQLNDSEISNIQTSFLELYSDQATHQDSISLVHYLLVKDGFNANNRGTFLNLIPADLKKGILNSIDSVQSLFNNNKATDEGYKRVFGMTKTELTEDLVLNYLKSTSAQFHVSEIDMKAKTKLHEIFTIETQKVGITEGTKTILPYPKETTIVTDDSSETTTLDITAPREFKYNNKTYYSVQHAYEVNKSGKYNKDLNIKYTKEKDSIGGINFKGKGKADLRLLSSLTKLSILQNLNKFAGQGTFASLVLSATKFNSVHLQADIEAAYVNGLLQAQKEIIYSKIMYGENAGEFIFATRSTINNRVGQDAAARLLPVVVDVDKGIVTQKLYNGIGTIYNNKIKTAKGINNITIKKETQLQFNNNRAFLKARGIYTVAIPIKTAANKTIFKVQMVLPLIKRKTMKDGRVVILELIRYQKDGKYEVNENTNSIVPNNNSVVFGNFAEYAIREEGPLGSKDQNPNGFLFGDRPSISQIEMFEENKRDAFAFDDGMDLDAEEQSDEFDDDEFDEFEDITEDEAPSGLQLLQSLSTKQSSILDELEVSEEDLVSEFYNSLTTAEKNKLGGNVDDVLNAFSKFNDNDSSEFIEHMKKCYLK